MLPDRGRFPFQSMDFKAAFKALTGNDPFPWQERLFERFLAGPFPAGCDIPTGLGKTAVVVVWLIALSLAPERVPRRLIYVVNRRTVVDQTTEEVVKMRKKLAAAEADSVLGKLKGGLAKLCADPAGLPLAISTLRGQFADNREWSADPCRPAVIIGPLDMIGSRRRFSG